MSRKDVRKVKPWILVRPSFTTVLNSISNTFFSMDLTHYASDKSQEFKDIIWGIMEEAGRPNVVDFFPIFRMLDPQGVRRRMNGYFEKLIAFFDGLVEENEEEDEDVEKNSMKMSTKIVEKSPKVKNELVKVIEKSGIIEFDCGVIVLKIMELWNDIEKYEGKTLPSYTTNELQEVREKYVCDWILDVDNMWRDEVFQDLGTV
ncbi:Geraniol 8-hydroxylase [Vigna angularis]|uniref:Geraniol 8-hydroxylase n=1 Tax=Phaseolus angularis TaxID=3914 RepID=A0A8T0JQW0_PHAAN|nr:Geraniol 8-hydroxylase [Vigna angularis]